MTKTFQLMLTALMLLTLVPHIHGQGTLTPPLVAFGTNNQPQAFMKTMDQIEPRILITSLPMIITNSGSFYLANSLDGTNGLFIDSDDVTIDLGGFGLSGDTNYPTHGVEIGLDVLNVTIKNGKIGDWGGWGIYSVTNADFFDVHDLVLELNNQGGMKLGPNCRVERVSSSENGGNGIQLGEAATIKDCKATRNESNGIVVNQGSTIVSCTVAQNKQDGIFAGTYCTIKDCTVVGNGGDGIEGHASCRVFDNNIGDGTNGAGIHMTGPGNQIKNNNITANGKGIRVDGASNWIENNGVIDNSVGIEVSGIGNLVIRNGVGTPLNTGGVHLVISPSNQVAEVLENLGTTFTNSNPWANIRLTSD